MRVAYCTGFWCTNIGNGFFSMGVEYALKHVLSDKNVTVVSDLQTYTTAYGKRLYRHKNQLEYISDLNVDYVVLAGPVLSKYFLRMWGDILRKLRDRGVGYILLSTGTMKLDAAASEQIKKFFQECPPYALSSREEMVYNEFGRYAEHAYNGICYSFFVPDAYATSPICWDRPYVVYNFDKIREPVLRVHPAGQEPRGPWFDFEQQRFSVCMPGLISAMAQKTDRFTDALIYAASVLPAPKRENTLGDYRIVRTDHRFHPHFRGKIYEQANSFVADLPHGYLNLYANASLTLSDRVHACAVTLAFGKSAMLFSKTNRSGLLDRVGAVEIYQKPVALDMDYLAEEKQKQLRWLCELLQQEN